MPKSKKVEESSDSDSGPDDKNPPPSKKTKKSEAPTKEPKESKSDEPASKWTLEKLRQVNINEFRGRKMVDIREFYEKNGDVLPGKKGISLSALQWRKLLEIADEVTAALENQ